MNISKVSRIAIVGYGECFKLLPGGGREYADGPTVTRLYRELLVNVEAVYASNSAIYVTQTSHPSWDLSNSVGYTYIVGGSTSEIPKPLTVEINRKRGESNGKRWREAAAGRSSEIIVSDYTRIKATITALPGTQDKPTSGDQPAELISYAKTVKPVMAIPGYVYHNGWYVSVGGVTYQAFRHYASRAFLQPEIPYSWEEILPHTNPDFDPGLVTDVTAKADKAAIDLLTAVAEMPKTLRSVVQGIRNVADAVVAVKKRQLTLSKSFDRRRAALDRALTRDQAYLDRLTGDARTRAQRRQIEWRRKKLQSTYNRSVFETSKELGDALANVWMNFRYNIMPNVYLLEDAQDLYSSYTAQYRTARGGDSDVVKLRKAGWTPLRLERRKNCVIKRELDPNLKLQSLIHANLVTTAWELVPLSFVVDWFINIGDVLTSSFSPNLALSQGATYGVKTEFEGIISNDNDDRICRYSISVYQRQVIQPELMTGISLSFDLNVMRQVDALALLWRPIRNTLLSSKR